MTRIFKHMPHTVTAEELLDYFMSERAVVTLASSSCYGNLKAICAIMHLDAPPSYEVTVGRDDRGKRTVSTLSEAIDLYNQAP